ncbi:hypothetical protein K2P97_13620 [bacterium]|nr:hypothetical protein [bacterium]
MQNKKPADKAKDSNTTEQEALVLNEDYYINDKGLYVFTEKYLLKRGYCCKNHCLHCPYEFKRVKN